MKGVDKTYEQSVNEVFNQYKNTISSRVANDDVSYFGNKSIRSVRMNFRCRRNVSMKLYVLWNSLKPVF